MLRPSTSLDVLVWSAIVMWAISSVTAATHAQRPDRDIGIRTLARTTVTRPARSPLPRTLGQRLLRRTGASRTAGLGAIGRTERVGEHFRLETGTEPLWIAPQTHGRLFTDRIRPRSNPDVRFVNASDAGGFVAEAWQRVLENQGGVWVSEGTGYTPQRHAPVPGSGTRRYTVRMDAPVRPGLHSLRGVAFDHVVLVVEHRSDSHVLLGASPETEGNTAGRSERPAIGAMRDFAYRPYAERVRAQARAATRTPRAPRTPSSRAQWFETGHRYRLAVGAEPLWMTPAVHQEVIAHRDATGFSNPTVARRALAQAWRRVQDRHPGVRGANPARAPREGETRTYVVPVDIHDDTSTARQPSYIRMTIQHVNGMSILESARPTQR